MHRNMSQGVEGHEFLTVEEVAAILRVKPYTVRKYFREGVLAGIKRGRRIFFHRESLSGYLAESREKPTAVLRQEVEAAPDPRTDTDHLLLDLPRVRLEVRQKNALFG